MSKVNFFTELFPLLGDKESIELKVQRTGDELTVLLVPKIKGKTATITICGTAEDLNDGFMDQLIIPVDKIKGLVSNAAEVKIEDVEEEEEEESEDDKKEKAEIKELAKKKEAPKKAAVKKSATKKVEEPVAETKTEGEINPEGKSTEAIEEDTYLKEAREREASAKEAAEKVAQEKAEKEAEEAARLQEAFDLSMKEGDEAFEARKYEDAEKHYQAASTLMPDHKAAKEKFEKANKWVKQLIAAGIIVREEVSNVNG